MSQPRLPPPQQPPPRQPTNQPNPEAPRAGPNVAVPDPGTPDPPPPPEPRTPDPTARPNPRPTPTHETPRETSARQSSPKDGAGPNKPSEAALPQDVFRSQETAARSHMSESAQAAVRTILSESHPITRSLEHLGRMLFSSGVLKAPTSLFQSAALKANGKPAALEQPFQGIIKMLTARSPEALSAPEGKNASSVPSDAVIQKNTAGPHPVNEKGESALQVIRQNMFQSLGAFLVSSTHGSQTLSRAIFQNLSKFLPLPFFQEGLVLSRFLGGKEVSVVLGAPSRPSIVENQALVKTFLQGVFHVVDNPAVKGFSGNLPAVWRALFGLFLMKGNEIQIRSAHSALLDELGALLSRSSRRARRKERKRIGRADRVQRKNESFPMDPDLHEGGETVFDEVDTWLKSPGHGNEPDTFSFYFQ